MSSYSYSVFRNLTELFQKQYSSRGSYCNEKLLAMDHAECLSPSSAKESRSLLTVLSSVFILSTKLKVGSTWMSVSEGLRSMGYIDALRHIHKYIYFKNIYILFIYGLLGSTKKTWV